jgi:hypothetical protein
VERVEELALEAPLELRIVEVAGVEVEVVGVDGDGGVLELDDDLDAFSFGAGGEVEEGMFVKAELGEDAVEAGVGDFRHRGIVKQRVVGWRSQEQREGQLTEIIWWLFCENFLRP